MLEAREATPEEAMALGFGPIAGIERWVGVLLEDGEIKGHTCLDRALGEVFGHDTKCWAASADGLAVLWIKARKKARDLGATFLNLHFTEGDGELMNFWDSQGFEPQFVVYRGAI